MATCYEVTREDGEELGTFDRLDDAERAAEGDAQTRNYGLKWMKVQGAQYGNPDTRGAGVHKFTIKHVPCE